MTAHATITHHDSILAEDRVGTKLQPERAALRQRIDSSSQLNQLREIKNKERGYMKLHRWLICCVVVTAVFSSLLSAQQDAPAQTLSVVPPLVNFAGKATDAQGKPITGIAGMTFSIYRDQYEGTPLWMETQNVQPDPRGNYTVQLGAEHSDGIPTDIFTSGEARWLGVRVNGSEEQPRVMLLSVPYALKAGDAQTFGGLPPSAFALAGSASASTPQSTISTGKLEKIPASNGSANALSPATVTGSGTKGKIPIWSSSTTLGNSAFFQTGTGTSAKVGLGTTTPGAPLDVHGIINSSAGFNLADRQFAFGSYATGNAFLGFAGNTTTTGELNTAVGGSALQSNTTGSTNTAVGIGALYSNTTGSSNTAVGAGTLGSTTASSQTGSYNTATGNGALAGNTTGSYNTVTGYQALYSLTNLGAVGTSSQNDAFGYQALFSNSCGSTPCTQDNDAFGYQALYSNTQGSENDAFGYQALFSNINGIENTAIGYQALYSNTGDYNTATGWSALLSNTIGLHNTADGNGALAGNTTGFYNTAIGWNSGVTVDESPGTGNYNSFLGSPTGMSTGSLNHATAIGAGTTVAASYAIVLGSSAAQNSSANVLVGIDVSSPTHILTVLQGGGNAIADGWATYSSRRWKTNIHLLQNALSKVQQLRGVSYDLKDSGKHEIGVIAEEVGQVVPEVVSYEKNGKDAQGVDYSRLTALLIEAVKQQQRQIVAQQKQIAFQQSQIRKQQRLTNAQELEISNQRQLMTTQQRQIGDLSRKVGTLESSLGTDHEQTTTVLASR
jgi:hypothetical protein